MRLSEKVNKEILPALAKEMKVPILSLPTIEKLTLNVGLSQYKEQKEAIEYIGKELMMISGQKPRKTLAKKSISGFKVREKQQVGFSVTLRKQRMWDFIERFVSIVLPRLRDFDGISPKSFDNSMNFTIGVKEQTIFPEVKADEIKHNWGMAITVKMKNTQNKDLTRDLLKKVGFIFKEDSLAVQPKAKK